jgi:uncharacterized membrane protein
MRVLRGYTPLRLLALSILAYFALFVALRSTADHGIQFDDRNMAPIYLWSVLAVGLLVDQFGRRMAARVSRRI